MHESFQQTMIQTLQTIDTTMDCNHQAILTILQANNNVRATVNPRIEAGHNQAIQVHQQQYNQGIDRRWENGPKVDIPEFQGSVRGEDLLD